MQHPTPSCQLRTPAGGDSRLISPRMGDTGTGTLTPDFEHSNDYSGGGGRGGRLLVTAASQWLHATTGRIATCAHSWMTAVQWVNSLAVKGLYRPARTHGPKWGATTVAIAQEISALKECRPGVDYLSRKLKVAERTVQYHLGMLREAGLLVYRSKGTRIAGVGGRASVFERVIPVAFDEALGIRTVGEGVTRRPVGAAPEHRTLLGKLAKKAARKARRRPRRASSTGFSTGEGRCTPMQVGTATVPSASNHHLPPETDLASGKREAATGKSSANGRTLNKVGRRFQLARELKQIVPWLNRASVPRLAWIVRNVADEGWTALEVQAAAEQMPVSADDARRPSGLLAYRLASCHLLYNTPERRQSLRMSWQESRVHEQARHTGYTGFSQQDHHTPAASVQELYAQALHRVKEIADRQEHGTDEQPMWEVRADGPDTPAHVPVTEISSNNEVPEWVQLARQDAAADPDSIITALESGMSEHDARALFTDWLVDQALAAARRLAPAF